MFSQKKGSQKKMFSQKTCFHQKNYFANKYLFTKKPLFGPKWFKMVQNCPNSQTWYTMVQKYYPNNTFNGMAYISGPGSCIY